MGGNAARAAAVMAKRTKQAVLRLDVQLAPQSGPGAVAGGLEIHAELWAAEAVTGVVEIDALGRVSKLLEEEIRPAGLLFGLAQEELVGAPLGSLLRLGPGQTAVGLLTESGIAKKSNLKAKKARDSHSTKVGPVHYLEGLHRDGRPLTVAVQVVGKPGPGNPVQAVLRLAPKSKTRHAAAAQAAAVAAASGMAAHRTTMATAGGGGGVSVHMAPSLAATAAATTAAGGLDGSKPTTAMTALTGVTAATTAAAATLGGGMGGGLPGGLPGGVLQFKLRTGSLSRNGLSALATAAAAAESLEGGAAVSAAGDISRKASLAAPAGDGGGGGETLTLPLPGAADGGDGADPAAPSPPLLTPGVSGSLSTAAAAAGAAKGTLAAGVASLLKARSLVPEASGAGAAAVAVGGGEGGAGEGDEAEGGNGGNNNEEEEVDEDGILPSPPPPPLLPKGGAGRPARRRGGGGGGGGAGPDVAADEGGRQGSDPSRPRTPDAPADGAPPPL
ncbi:hypothetical protein GPECTOR_118g386 [Gonium pectorale]|uniref:Uncharacterized protein n=1 Tax=Gonium pectorale TaxID=33097 RepID=A0A150FYX3_GONPE|nr:hypothetical protein GPECTOR_118g386 [Gonium pectorale]|eukprot:KXZ42789.1 hypothetical protein GPECTOR_118g386 [Gonium pectorale]